MCGIAGVVGLAREEGRATVARMLGVLAHRGPDAEGIAAGDGWAVGARRLAILDLATGDQPVHDEEGRVHAVLNGEIYNFEELRTTLAATGHRLRSTGDTEVLVHLWEELGGQLVARLRGMFALAVVDEGARTLLLARDRVGKKPLYYWPRGDTVLFASELKALWAAVGHGPTIDEGALDSYLAWGFVPEGQCIAHGVHKLPPAHRLTIDLANGVTSIARYWQVPACPEGGVGFAQAVAEVRAILPEAVRLRTRADVPVAVFLSGGVDSGCVAALAAGTTARRALCVTFAGVSSELPLARRTARRWGLDLEEVPVAAEEGIDLLPELATIFDEPLADPSVIPTVLVARRARRVATVVLNGDGGDELFGGYRRWLAARLKDSLGRWAPLAGETLALVTRFGGDRLHRLVEAMRQPHLYDVLGPAKLPPAAVAALRGRPPSVPPALAALAASMGSNGSLDAMRRLEVEFFLPGDLLVKMDRATMAASLEARSPFLDHVLVERVSRVPTRVLLRGFQCKAVLRKAARDWLPAAVRHAPKRGFEVPLVEWLQGPWREIVRETLADPTARLRHFLDGGALERWLNWEQHPDRTRAARAVFTLLTLEQWLRRWQ